MAAAGRPPPKTSLDQVGLGADDRAVFRVIRREKTDKGAQVAMPSIQDPVSVIGILTEFCPVLGFSAGREVPVLPATGNLAPFSRVAVPSRGHAFQRPEEVSAVAREQIDAFSTLGPRFCMTFPLCSLLSTNEGFIIFPLPAIAL